MGAMSQDMVCTLISLDIAKSYDLMEQQVLLRKLGWLDSDWFRSYLANRKQYVQIDKEKSSMQIIEKGSPLGSTLSKLLFLLMVNDLPHLFDWSSKRIPNIPE